LARIADAHLALINLLKTLSGVVIFGAFVLIVFDVFVRLAGLQPWLYSTILVEYGLLWFTMLAAPWLARTKGHVFIDALTQLLPVPARRLLAKLVYLICIVVCGVFCFYSMKLLVGAWVDGEIDTRAVDVPLWTLLAPIPFSFALVAIEFVRFLFDFDSMYGDRTEVRDNM
jgi:TRAP-type C4-dicarboxylate transport system permease small subunit